MSTKDTGGAAFPGALSTKDGMTLRDYFAGQALTGLLSYGLGPNAPWADHPPSLAINAYEIADAMIAERSK